MLDGLWLCRRGRGSVSSYSSEDPVQVMVARDQKWRWLGGGCAWVWGHNCGDRWNKLGWRVKRRPLGVKSADSSLKDEYYNCIRSRSNQRGFSVDNQRRGDGG